MNWMPPIGLYTKKREQLLAEVDIMDRYLQKYSYTHQKKWWDWMNWPGVT